MRHAFVFLVATMLLGACGAEGPPKPVEESEEKPKPPSTELQLALENALKTGDLKKARKLIEQGADVDAHVDNGDRLIHAICNPSVYRDGLATARFLKEHGADLTSARWDFWTPLTEATWWNQIKLMEFFEENGADLKATFPGPIPHSIPGYTLLHVAAVRIDTAALRWLLPKGLKNVNHRNPRGWILPKGLDVNARNSLGETPLLLAAEKGNAEAVKLLIEGGADKSIADKKGRTPLQLAQAGAARWKDDSVNRKPYEQASALLKG